MSPLTSALISYWQRLPAESPAVRRLALNATLEELRAGRGRSSELATCALGDIDDDIVRDATLGYVQAPGAGRGAIEEALEWIRRGLALNRGAVFVALLELGDHATIERLAGLRLTLGTEEVALLCRQLPPTAASTTWRFLAEWVELLEGSAETGHRKQLDLLREVLAAQESGEFRRAAA